MEGAQSKNIRKNSVKRYKGLSIQRSQNTLQDDHDWISRLPDSLLLHILSQLRIEEVIMTSLLSKRWRYLWTSFSCLDFSYLKTGRKFEKTTFIDRCLFHHDESKVDKLHVRIEYEERHSLLVDSWIQFAARHEVKQLKLDLFDGKSPEHISSEFTVYKLPHSLFRCGSLTSLELYGCDLNLPDAFQLNSLLALYLKNIDLDAFAIERITSNCPVLEKLSLTRCNVSTDLNICITNDNIKLLTISEGDYGFDNGITTIYAPNLILLEFHGRLQRTNYHFEQLRSLVSVYFCGHDDMSDVLSGEDIGYDFTQLLHDLHDVEVFTFSRWCIQALTAKEICRLDPVSINATCINISSGLTKWELPGIAYLLKSASYLERLQILPHLLLPESELSDEFLEEYDFEVKDFWKLRELDSLSILQNIKTITIGCLYGNSQVKDYNGWEQLTELVRFLLKTSKVLERMTINTFGPRKNSVELMLEVAQKLLSFPRASPNAGLFFN